MPGIDAHLAEDYTGTTAGRIRRPYIQPWVHRDDIKLPKSRKNRSLGSLAEFHQAVDEALLVA